MGELTASPYSVPRPGRDLSHDRLGASPSVCRSSRRLARFADGAAARASGAARPTQRGRRSESRTLRARAARSGAAYGRRRRDDTGGTYRSGNTATPMTPTSRALPVCAAYECGTDENRNAAASDCEIRQPSTSTEPQAGIRYPRFVRKSPGRPLMASRPSTETTASTRRAEWFATRSVYRAPSCAHHVRLAVAFERPDRNAVHEDGHLVPGDPVAQRRPRRQWGGRAGRGGENGCGREEGRQQASAVHGWPPAHLRRASRPEDLAPLTFSFRQGSP